MSHAVIGVRIGDCLVFPRLSPLRYGSELVGRLLWGEGYQRWAKGGGVKGGGVKGGGAKAKSASKSM